MKDTSCRTPKSNFQYPAFGKQEPGFTLLEIMISLAIIGITLSVILDTVNRHSDILYQNTIITRMYQIAKEKMYELEKSQQQAKGNVGNEFQYENIVVSSQDSNIVKLKTVVSDSVREVTLTELVVKKEEMRY